MLHTRTAAEPWQDDIGDIARAKDQPHREANAKYWQNAGHIERHIQSSGGAQ